VRLGSPHGGGSAAVPQEQQHITGEARGLGRIERGLASVAIALMVLLPLAEILTRRLLQRGVPGSIPFVQHLTLWVGLLGGAIAASEQRMLALATGTFVPEGRVRDVAHAVAAAVGAFVSALLFRGAVQLVQLEREAGSVVALGVPVWVAQLVLPVGFALIAWRIAWGRGAGWGGRAAGIAGIAVGLWFGGAPAWLTAWPAWPGVVLVIVAGLLGTPIFAVLGGVAALLFLSQDVPPAAILVETYQLSVNATLPAIPLFTLAGFLLAEGNAPDRLLRVFRAWFGWLPGSTAVVCVLVSAFFSVFTGGSGVTILALGGVLLPMLLADRYGDRFALGLLTSAGSLGMTLPTALPLILYGIVSQTSIDDLFLGGLIPGLFLLGLVVGYAVRQGRRAGAAHRVPFVAREALAAAWTAKFELLLPVVILLVIFSGWATLVEAAALAAFYTFITQAFVHRDFSLRRDMGRVFADAVTTIGGVLIILGVAVGLTNYLVDADVPGRLLVWTQTYVDSRLVFLLGLNLFLLVVGCLMDIFSATFVVVPLIVPLGQAYAVDPVHLGVVFIANLELGYLTPPVGLNLFLASYRFKRPLMEVVRAVMPWLLLRTVGVVIITYVPWLTLGLLDLLGRR
jgi:tripartite ATP-independent transporter DctM subunit